MELIIDFAEWVGINTFDGMYMRHEVSDNTGIHKWKLYNESDYISTNKLYQKFCDIKGIEFTSEQKILYYDNKFELTNFIEYIGNRNLFYFCSSYNGTLNEPYWTKYNGKCKFTTNELYKDFKNKI